MASRDRTDDVTDPSNHTNYSYLNTPEKNDRLTRMHNEKRQLSVLVRQLEERLSIAISQYGITPSDELHRDIKVMAGACTTQIYSTYLERSFPRLFWNQQVKTSEYKNSKSMKWHPLFIKWCLYLRHLSGKCYEQLQKSGCVKLPSQSTLRDYTHHIPAKIVFSSEIDQHLVDVAFSTTT